MPRLILLVIAIVVGSLCLASRPANAQGYAYFPPLRTYQPQYLRRTFRLPIEALLEADTPVQLARRSEGVVPTFAAAPVVESLKNPFANDPGNAPADESTVAGDDAGLFADDDTTGAGATANESDPFASDGPTDVAGGDPFAEPSDAPAGGDDDPFSDDDPFADF